MLFGYRYCNMGGGDAEFPLNFRYHTTDITSPVTMAPTDNVYMCVKGFLAQSYAVLVTRTPISWPVSPSLQTLGERNVYPPYDPFFVEIRNPNFTVCLLDDDMTVVDLQGTPWALTLYRLCVPRTH
jgi:hypothetical protein